MTKGKELIPVFSESDDTELMVMSSGLSIKKDSFFVTGDDVDKVLESIKQEVSSYVADLSTTKGRAEVTKTVSIVTNCKTYLEAQGKELSAHHKTIPGKIDANRAKVKAYLTQLQVDVRKPLTDYQDEQEKIKVQQEAEEAAEKLLVEFNNDHEMSLLMDEAFDRKAADELARLAQEQIDRDALIASQAKEKATVEANLLAQKLIDDAQELKQKAIDDKIKSDNELLASQAAQKILEEQAAQTKINNQWLAIEQEAHNFNDQLNFDVEQKRLADLAEKNRLASIETARLNQIALQKIEGKRIADEAAKRAADKEHNRAVNQGIVAAFQAAGLSYDDAVKAVTAMVRGIDNVSINY